MNIIKLNRLLKQSSILQSAIFNNRQCVITSCNNYAKLSPEQKPDWNRAVSEAEKIVGYPTSFFNLRWLLSDEVANVALHLRKLVGSNHPLLKTAKSLLYNGKNTMQTWGLIVLLLSKAAGHSPNIPDMEQDKAAGVLHSQRALAEITEMIRTSYAIHKSLVNLQSIKEIDGDMLFGNKISLLSGDYLLATSCAELAALRNQELVELIAAALRDQSEAEFIEPRDSQNAPLPAKPKSLRMQEKVATIGEPSTKPLVVFDALGDARSEWTLRNVLSAGSLLGKACQGTLKLAGHPLKLQDQGYLFGKHLALAWQACLDRVPFQNPINPPFSLISAPVMFQLEHDPTLYSEIEKGMDSVSNVNYNLIHEAVLSGPGLEQTCQLQKEHSEAALEVLKQFPKTDARQALTNIIVAMEDL